MAMLVAVHTFLVNSISLSFLQPSRIPSQQIVNELSMFLSSSQEPMLLFTFL